MFNNREKNVLIIYAPWIALPKRGEVVVFGKTSGGLNNREKNVLIIYAP